MTYALVGSVGTPSSGATSVTPAFGQATSAGNLLIAWASCLVGAALTTSSTGWVQAVDFIARVAIWYKPNCGAGETAPTFTDTGGTSPYLTVALAEFSGGATTTPLDKTASGQSLTSPDALTASGADVAAGQLIIAISNAGYTKAGTTTTGHSYNNGAVAQAAGDTDTTSTLNHYRFSYGITTGNSAADSVSMSDTSMNLAQINGAFASFKLAAGGAAHSLGYDDRRIRRNSLLRR